MEPHVVLNVGDRLDTIVQMLARHESQVFDFVPYLVGGTSQIPADAAERIDWLKQWYINIIRPRADHCRVVLRRLYSAEQADSIDTVEMFEISEYGAILTDSLKATLFPWMTGAWAEELS
jgi:hypothetical protein